MYPGSEPPRGEREQTAARADVEERPAPEIGGLEHCPEGLLRIPDALVGQDLEETPPVFPEGEALPARDLLLRSGRHASVPHNSSS
jgi:hypothetical protein